jgi:hypothetical protein
LQHYTRCELTNNPAAACLVVVNPHNIKSAIAPIVLSLVGTGGVLIPNQVVMTVITPDEFLASATALTVGLRAQAQVLGLSIFYNRFASRVAHSAKNTIFPAMLASGIYDTTLVTGFITSLTAYPYDELAARIPQLADNSTSFALVKELTVECFSDAMKLVYYITIPFGVVACLVAACMGDVSQYMDEHVAVVL